MCPGPRLLKHWECVNIKAMPRRTLKGAVIEHKAPLKCTFVTRAFTTRFEGVALSASWYNAETISSKRSLWNWKIFAFIYGAPVHNINDPIVVSYCMWERTCACAYEFVCVLHRSTIPCRADLFLDLSRENELLHDKRARPPCLYEIHNDAMKQWSLVVIFLPSDGSFVRVL